jgi:hypothetical protein
MSADPARRLLAEAIGTGILVLFGAGSVMAALTLGGRELDYAGLGMVAITFALAIALVVYAFGNRAPVQRRPRTQGRDVTCRPWPSPVLADRASGAGDLARWRRPRRRRSQTTSPTLGILAYLVRVRSPRCDRRSDQLIACGVGQLRSAPARRFGGPSGCAPAGACRPGCWRAAESSVDRSRSIAPDGVLRVRDQAPRTPDAGGADGFGQTFGED